jgi:putative transposase
MTNHVHLLLTPDRENSIPELMQTVGREYVQSLNRKYNRTGMLWEGRYKASVVQSDFYLLACYRYIELNPVRAGMVFSPGDYSYSSYRHNALGEQSSLISPHETFLALGPTDEKRRVAYQYLFSTSLSSNYITQFRKKTNACRPIGDRKFQDQVEAMTGRSVRPGKPGPKRRKSIEP